MTPVKIVDASAVSALLFGEPDADAVAARLDGAALVAPTLLAFEVANVAVMKMRRNPEQKTTVAAAFALLERMPIDAVTVDHGAVVALAEKTRLTAYDASYLWVAREMEAELITLDRELHAAATR